MNRPGITVRPGIYLSRISFSDKPAMLEYLSTRDVHITTLNIPYPYTEADADGWLKIRMDHAERVRREVSFAIRDADGKMIGAVGADSLEPGIEHRAELGYWLAKPHWGRGIMTDAVRAYIGYAFDELHLSRLVAHVFEFNKASARVLEKNGFILEGRLRKHFRKNGELLDARVYGLLKEDRLT